RAERFEEDSNENMSNLYQLTLPLSQVGSAGAHVGSESTHVGSPGTSRWGQGEPQVGSQGAPDLLLVTAFSEQPSAPVVAVKKDRPKGPRQKRLFEAPPSDHQQVKDCYLEEFKRARGVDRVPFEGREAKAINELIRKTGSVDAACNAIRNAFGGYFKTTTTIIIIAKNPARFVGKSPANGHRAPDVQHDGYDAERSKKNAAYIIEQRQKASRT